MRLRLLFSLIIISVFYTLPFAQPATVLVTEDWENIFIPRILGLEFVEDQAIAVSQDGVLYRIDRTQSPHTRVEFLDLTDEVGNPGGERGLLGLAFHPDFPNTSTFYVNYTRDNPLTTVISEWQVNPSTWEVNESSERILLTYEQPFANHNGGHIAFGPNGYLYISSGDGGSAGDPMNNAQDTSSLLGKILRINVDESGGGLEYGIPVDNPFLGRAGRDEIYAWGIRNAWRFSFDRDIGELWAADVGQNAYECIHVIFNGRNYGWRILEGSHCYNPSVGCDSTGLELPVFEYSHSQGDRSITGGYVYRGKRQPLLHRKYLYGDFVSGRIWALAVTPDALQFISNEELLNTNINVSAFAEDDEGEIYVLTYGSGGVRRIVVEPPVPEWTHNRDTIIETEAISWSSMGAEVGQYLLEVSRDSMFTDVVYQNAVADSAFQPATEIMDIDEGVYFSRVRAENAAGETEYSAVSSWYYNAESTSSSFAFSAGDILVYPNPTSEIIQVEWPKDFQVDQYVVRNVQGQAVLQGRDMNPGSLRLRVGMLPAGSYNLGLVGAKGRVLWRPFVVQ